MLEKIVRQLLTIKVVLRIYREPSPRWRPSRSPARDRPPRPPVSPLLGAGWADARRLGRCRSRLTGTCQIRAATSMGWSPSALLQSARGPWGYRVDERDMESRFRRSRRVFIHFVWFTRAVLEVRLQPWQRPSVEVTCVVKHRSHGMRCRASGCGQLKVLGMRGSS